MVIDGLDECARPVKREITSWIRSTVTSVDENDSWKLCCCVISQDDKDIGRLLRGAPSLKITKKHNSYEILRLCHRRASDIDQAFGLGPQQAQQLAKQVAEKVDGESSSLSRLEDS